MHRVVRASLLVAAVVLVASCQTGAGNPSPTEIGEGLLAVTDLDTEWRETQRDVFDERGVENPVLDAGAFCPEAEISPDDLDSLAGQAGADVEFQKKDGSAAIRLQAWSNADTVTFDDTVSVAVATCDGQTWTDEFGTVATLAVVEGPEVGDSSVHWSTTFAPSDDNGDQKGDKANSIGRTSVVRFNDAVMILQWGTFGSDAAASIDEIWWSELVGEAYEKLDDAL